MLNQWQEAAERMKDYYANDPDVRDWLEVQDYMEPDEYLAPKSAEDKENA